MAKIKRIFSMQPPPDEAQAAFVEDIVPELVRKGELSLSKHKPGMLEFAYLVGPVIRGHRARPEHRVRGSPRIRVTFESQALGTIVTIEGRCERHIRDALCRLGEAGHWPEQRDDARRR